MTTPPRGFLPANFDAPAQPSNTAAGNAQHGQRIAPGTDARAAAAAQQAAEHGQQGAGTHSMLYYSPALPGAPTDEVVNGGAPPLAGAHDDVDEAAATAAHAAENDVLEVDEEEADARPSYYEEERAREEDERWRRCLDAARRQSECAEGMTAAGGGMMTQLPAIAQSRRLKSEQGRARQADNQHEGQDGFVSPESQHSVGYASPFAGTAMLAGAPSADSHGYHSGSHAVHIATPGARQTSGGARSGCASERLGRSLSLKTRERERMQHMALGTQPSRPSLHVAGGAPRPSIHLAQASSRPSLQANAVTSPGSSAAAGSLSGAADAPGPEMSGGGLNAAPSDMPTVVEAAGGVADVEEQHASIMAVLAEEHQMLLEFKHISSWVTVATPGASGSDRLKGWAQGFNKAAGKLKNSTGSLLSRDKTRTTNTQELLPVSTRPNANTAVATTAGAQLRQRHAGVDPTAANGEAAAAKSAGSAGNKEGSAESKDKAQHGLLARLKGGKKDVGPGPGGKGGQRQILHNITGRVLPGRVLALMGPSGSGKTSLLAVVGGRTPRKIKISGQILVNGERMTKANRKRIGFVLQDDVLYETLTVKETLMYAALLRLPPSMSRAEKMARVEAVMAVLGLTRNKDTIIGGYFRRGVSGGERKRVSVGHELLVNPSVLLLDEPTSGLDSTTALHLVNLLRDLASGGRSILTTIHQPSSRLYRQLDQVMLLSEGHMCYYGDAAQAVDWFDHLGFGLPYGTNLADHILDCAMGEVSYNPDAPGASPGVNRVSGSSAIRCLYTTFENWYRDHPDGFTVSSVVGTGAAAARARGANALALPPAGGDAADGEAADGDAGAGSEGRTRSGDVTEIVTALLSGVRLMCPRTSMTLHGSAHGGNAAMQGDSKALDAKKLPVGQQLASTTEDGEAPAIESSAAQGVADGAAIGVLQRELLRGTAGSTTADGADDRKPGDQDGALRAVVVHPLGSSAGTSSSSSSKGSSTAAARKQSAAGNAVAAGNTGSSGQNTGGEDLDLRGAPFAEQVLVLWQRAVKVRRFESLSGQNIFQLVGVALITGLLWWQRGAGTDISAGSDILGLLFFELLFPSFRSLFAALFTFPNEFRMLSKERPSGMYRLSSYYIARTAADLPLEIMLPGIFIIIVYWFGGLRATAGAFFSNFFSLILVVFIAQSWGLLIGGLFMDPKMAQTLTTVIMLTFLLVGGFYVRDVPVWIGWLKYLSFVYWGNNLLTKIQFRHNSLTNCANAQPGQPCPQVDNLQNALRLPVDPDDSTYPEVLVLLAMLIILRIATYFVLRWKTAPTQKV